MFLCKQRLLTPKLISSHNLIGSAVALCLYKVRLQSCKQMEQSLSWFTDRKKSKNIFASHGSHTLWPSSENGRYQGVQEEILLAIDFWANRIEHSRKQLYCEYFLCSCKPSVSSGNRQFRLTGSNILMASSASIRIADNETKFWWAGIIGKPLWKVIGKSSISKKSLNL